LSTSSTMKMSEHVRATVDMDMSKEKSACFMQF